MTGLVHRDVFRLNEETIDVGPGTVTLELAVPRSYSVALVFEEAGTPIPTEWSWIPRACEHLDGGGRVVSWSSDEKTLRMSVDRPGRYRVELPQIEGYLPLGDQVVTVLGYETPPHAIELVRKP